MKADYLRYIFECLDGDDGLLKNDEMFTITQDGKVKVLSRQKERFDDDTEDRLKNEINRFEKQITCQVCNMSNEADVNGSDKKAAKQYFESERTLIEYFKHEVYHDYEKAKQEIFDKDFIS